MAEVEAVHESVEAARMDIEECGGEFVVPLSDVHIDMCGVLALLFPHELLHGEYRSVIAVLAGGKDVLWKILHTNTIAGTVLGRPANNVFEFADVSRPIVLLQDCRGAD